MQAFLDRIAELPVLALYAVLGLVAAIENIFPPFPADTVVAFGSFLAARGHGTALGSFLATWLGNIAGAAIMYTVGRRYGAAWLERRAASGGTAERLRRLHGRYGLAALFLSRFLPGVRAIVPPFAGALRLPPVPSLAVMAVASGIWYGVITYLSFRVGSSWEELAAAMRSTQRSFAIGAAAVVAVALVVWLVRRRRARPSP